jgi:hypothetical protein
MEKTLLTGPTPKRRHVIIKINTIPLDFAPGSRSFVPLNRRMVTICILVDDGHQISRHTLYQPSERLVLKSFWAKIRPYDVIIGEHGVEADFALLRQRTFVHGLAPETEFELQSLYSHDVVDLDTHSKLLTMALESEYKASDIQTAADRFQRDRSAAALWTQKDWEGIHAACQSRLDALYRRLQLLMQ